MMRSMEPMCEFCGVVRAVVYCKSDLACLCLQCDGYVHSANALSKRHLRSLLCDKCNSQPATTRCLEDKFSFCESCDWNGNACLDTRHVLQTLSFYSGCPSTEEFMKIWCSVLDDALPGDASSKATTRTCTDNSTEAKEIRNSVGLTPLFTYKLNELNEFETLMCPSSGTHLFQDSKISCQDQAQGCLQFKDPNVCDVDIMHEGFDMDDSGLNSDSSSEVHTGSQSQPGYSFADVGMDCSLMEKSFSVTESDGPKQNAAEASSSGQHDGRVFCSSHSVGSVQVVQAVNSGSNQVPINPCSNRNVSLNFHNGQVHSSLPLSVSNITCENSVTDFSDCGLSSEASESPWDSNLESSCLEARNRAKMRYNEKKKTRKFGKQIGYAPLKARAETRKHVRGKFTRAGETYDNNPVVERN